MTIRTVRALSADERGQDLAEYGIALAVITAAVGLLAAIIGGDVNQLWTNARNGIPTLP